MSCPLTRKEAWVSYQMYFVPSYTYRSVTLSFTVHDTNNIHRTFMSSLLNRLGYQATFSRAVAFEPKYIGGIGITPMNVIITHRKIKFLYRHLRSNKDLSRAIIINLK